MKFFKCNLSYKNLVGLGNSNEKYKIILVPLQASSLFNWAKIVAMQYSVAFEYEKVQFISVNIIVLLIIGIGYFNINHIGHKIGTIWRQLTWRLNIGLA